MVKRFIKLLSTEEDGKQLFFILSMTEQGEMAFNYTVKDSDYQKMEGKIFWLFLNTVMGYQGELMISLEVFKNWSEFIWI